MCSAIVSPDEEPRTTAQVGLSSGGNRIVESALELIADKGVDGTSVRAVARKTGVSPALVIHHFGSKDGLVEACDHRVLGAVDAGLAEFVKSGTSDSITAALVSMVADSGMLGYLRRSITDGGVVGDHLFDHLFTMTVSAVEQMEIDGTGRHTDDIEMRALIFLALDLGMVLLHQHVQRVLGSPLESPEITERWVTEELEMLTHGALMPRSTS